ncbi:uncharacterized protein LOC111383788 [Olea europaea var. sylvestris]|uniref:uncharacterized protein LOC111383788 n=1 Tax=Olea europaea var. sylvestris TaxID=158386 RepID=UPI000C1D1FD1|nr:uncharacterized protein LOC111383788 [Olea europaea var. sylvestris]
MPALEKVVTRSCNGRTSSILDAMSTIWPYKLQWLNESGEVRVNRRVLVNLSIRSYRDEMRRTITLVPLAPVQVYEDQIKLRNKEERRAKELEERRENSEPKKKKGNSEVVNKRENESLLNFEKTNAPLLSLAKSLLQEFKNIFLNDMSSGLPHIRGIEHQIDFITRAVIPNRPA